MKNENIAKVLKAYRRRNNLTVHQVSILLENQNIKAADKTIYGWESGQTQPNADTLLTLCDIYNIHNILGPFGYNRDLNFNITKHEEELVKQYRRNPKLQKAVDKLLDIE